MTDAGQFRVTFFLRLGEAGEQCADGGYLPPGVDVVLVVHIADQLRTRNGAEPTRLCGLRFAPTCIFEQPDYLLPRRP